MEFAGAKRCRDRESLSENKGKEEKRREALSAVK